MQYLLTLYSDESAWGQMTPEQQGQGVAAYSAYTEALQSAGVPEPGTCRKFVPATTLGDGDYAAHGQRQDAGAGWPLCRIEGTTGRVLPDRGPGSGCSAAVGRPMPRGAGWGSGSTGGLGDVTAAAPGACSRPGALLTLRKGGSGLRTERRSEERQEDWRK